MLVNKSNKPDISKEIIDKWQRLVNLMAKLMGVPAGLIMKIDPPEIEVFISSNTEGNPYYKGERANLNTGLYCETVMQKRESLLVPDAAKDKEWDHNPDMSLGMVYYLGFPLEWPDGDIFGTICVLDYKDNPKATNNKDLINEFKTIIETDLDNVLKKYELESEKEKLRKSEEKYRLLAEIAGDLIFVHDINGKILYANKSGLEKTGYSTEDLPKLRIMDLVPREYKKILDSNIKERLKGDMSSKIYEIECLTKLGVRMPLEVISVPFFIDEVLTFQVIARDISERKIAEKAIKESNILYSTIAENIPNGIVHVFDKDFRYLYNAGEELNKLGLTNETLVGKSIHDILPPDTARYVDQHYKRVLKGEKVNFEGKTFLVNAIPLKNPSGEIDKILVLSVNITDRKKIENELKESEEKYRELVENANSIITKYDKNGTILSMNGYGLKFFGYREEELIGKNFIGTITPKIESTGRNLHDFLLEMFSNLEKYPQNLNENIKKNGERVWVLWTNRQIKDENGNIIGLYSVGTDVTNRKIAEDKVKRLNETLRILNKILSHDIANNLTVASMALQIMETKDEALREKAERSIAKSVELIEKIRGLEFAASNEKITGTFDVNKIIERVTKNYLEINFNIQGSGTVMADEALEPVFDNIIRNAIFHGKTDRIDISTTCTCEICEIRIADYGKGIPDEIKERIFEEGFSYGENRSTGLGLYIVKNIIEKYGGEISLEDNKPSGAIFILRLKKA